MKRNDTLPFLIRLIAVALLIHFLLTATSSAESDQFPDHFDGLRIEAHHAFLVTQDGEKVLRIHAALFNDGLDEATVLTKTGAATD